MPIHRIMIKPCVQICASVYICMIVVVSSHGPHVESFGYNVPIGDGQVQYGIKADLNFKHITNYERNRTSRWTVMAFLLLGSNFFLILEYGEGAPWRRRRRSAPSTQDGRTFPRQERFLCPLPKASQVGIHPVPHLSKVTKLT